MHRNKAHTALALLVALAVILVIASNYVNLGAFLSNAAAPLNFCFSAVYLSIWLLILALAKKCDSEKGLLFYLVVWALHCLYFGLYLPLIDSPLAVLWYVGVVVFFMPMVGFYYPYSLVQDALQLNFLYDVMILPFLLISVAMLAGGFAAYRKAPRQSR